MSFDWRGGVHLVGSDLWFDAARAPGLTFVSHAGIRASGARLLTSPVTAKVHRALGRRTRPLCPPLGRPLSIGEHRVELLRSDLVPGAALLRVENESGAAIYAGALTAGAEVRACDRLCLVAPEPADGVPIESVLVVALDSGAVVDVPGLAEAYAAANAAIAAGVAVRAPAPLRTALRALGVSLPAGDGATRAGELLLWPAESPEGRPADRPALRLRPIEVPPAVMVAYARSSGARDVVVAGRLAADTALRLRGEGIGARPVSAPDQLGLFAADGAPGAA
jgi:hypothetical protein